MNYKLKYPSVRQRRGRVSILLAVTGEILFGFFLFFGFGEQSWAGTATAILSVAMLLVLLSGVSIARSGKGSVEITDQGLTVLRGNRRIHLSWHSIDSVRFGGIFQPTLELHAGSAKAVLYKALPGYPLVWSFLARTRAGMKVRAGSAKIRCNRTQHMGVLVAGIMLSIAAAAVVNAIGFLNGLTPLLGGALITLFIAVAALGLWTLISAFCTYTLEEDCIRCRSWFREIKFPAADLREVTLEQARIRKRTTGYRYPARRRRRRYTTRRSNWV